jgi:predicted transposase YdaD
MFRPFDAASKHLIETQPWDWLKLAGLPVWSAVFLLRPQALVSSVTGRLVGRLNSGSHLDFAYQLVRVWELPTELILTGGLGTIALAPITAVQPDELPPVIEKVRQRLAGEIEPEAGEDILTAMRVLIGLRYQHQITETLMQSISEMEDSVEWQKIFRRGENQGQSKGRIEGKLEGERDLVIRLGTLKFGPPNEEIRSRLMSIEDPDALAKLSEQLLNSSSGRM